MFKDLVGKDVRVIFQNEPRPDLYQLLEVDDQMGKFVRRSNRANVGKVFWSPLSRIHHLTEAPVAEKKPAAMVGEEGFSSEEVVPIVSIEEPTNIVPKPSWNPNATATP